MKPLESISRPKTLHKTAQDAIRRYIVENQLLAGDALPGELQLARQLGVGRNSVREAIKSLESLGIVEVRRGQGVFVKAFSFEPLLDGLSYGLLVELKEVNDLLEIRQALESGMISRAISLIPDDDLTELGATVDAMRDQARHGIPIVELDGAFHSVLFRCLGNETLLQLLDIFWVAFRRASAHIDIRDETPTRTAESHGRILEAIRARDDVQARRALEDHYAGIRLRLAHAKENAGNSLADDAAAAKAPLGSSAAGEGAL